MRRSLLLFAAIAVSAFASSHLSPAFAQAARTWVSGTGNDSNDCSRAAPCLTFAGAIAKTNVGGEINCLDTGPFGGVTITKAIVISCQGGTAGVLVSGSNGITINVAAGAGVVLRGLDIQGSGTGFIGVAITQSGTVRIEKCVIRGFNAGAAYGVQLASTASPTKLSITNSSIIDNGTGSTGGGVNIAPGAGGNAIVVLKRVRVTNNVAGVVVNGSGNTTTNNVTIEDSEIAGNSNTGVLAVSSGSGSPATVTINRSVLTANAPTSLTANGTAAVPGAGSAVVRITGSVITANSLSYSVVGQGQILSYKNNMVDGNATDATPIPQVNLR
jgi:hypothetical protein